MSDPVNTGFIPDMQSKLYGWSRSNPTQVFDDLFNLVCDHRSLHHAWKQLSRNAGSRTPGVDGLTRRKIEERPDGVNGFLNEVHTRLKEGTYVPQPVRQRLIPKPGKPGKFRPLGIPTLTDRLVQMALKNVLEPIFEADFYPTSYGFRRGRSTHDALAMLKRQLEATKAGASKFDFVIEGDIKGCFDNIDHHVLMGRVRKRVKDKKVLRLTLAFLKAGIMAEGSIRHPVAGTPQGGIISPLLANIMLTAIDERYGRWTPRPGESSMEARSRRSWDQRQGRPTFYIVRYADDFVILVSGEKHDAEREKERLAAFLGTELKLELSAEKTLVTAAENGFEFLGFRIIKEYSRKGRMSGNLKIPKGKLLDIRHRIKQRTTRSRTGESLRDLLKELNPLIAGWSNYYRYATGATKEFQHLDWWLWHRIQGWLGKKHHKTSSHDIRRMYAKRETPTRWSWGEEDVLLRRFGKTRSARYLCRGTRISNGWNDSMDGVKFYPGVALPISGFTWVGELW
jgi:RNA-directed DNA polymerase